MGAERRAQQREFDFNAQEAEKQRTWESMQADINRNFESREAALNRDFQSSEAETGRAWQTAERLAQQQFQQDEWNRQQEYNSPVNQAQRVRAAGLNPAVYFQGSSMSVSGGNVSAPSAPSTSVPSGSMPSGSVPSGAAAHSGSQIVSNIPQLLGAASGLMEAIGNYRSNTAQASEIKSLLEERLKGLVLDNSQKALTNSYLDTRNSIQKATKNVQVLQAFENYCNTFADTEYKKAMTGEAVSQEALNKSQQALNKAVEGLKGNEAALVKLEIGAFNQKTQSYLKTQESERQKNRAQAEESSEHAKLYGEQSFSESRMRTIREEGARLDNRIKRGDIQFADKTYESRARSIILQNKVLEDQHILMTIKSEDEQAYTAIQRILRGKTNDGDWSKVFRALQGLDAVPGVQGYVGYK